MVSRPLDQLGKVVEPEFSCSRIMQQASKEPLNNVTPCWLGGVSELPVKLLLELELPVPATRHLLDGGGRAVTR